MKQIRIKRSPIHGLGAFATTAISAGTMLHAPEHFPGYNMSCAPNVESPSDRWSRGGDRKIQGWITMRDIKPGEELTVQGFGGFGCNCDRCRKKK